jgi:hypothetical protein
LQPVIWSENSKGMLLCKRYIKWLSRHRQPFADTMFVFEWNSHCIDFSQCVNDVSVENVTCMMWRGCRIKYLFIPSCCHCTWMTYWIERDVHVEDYPYIVVQEWYALD